MNDVNDEVFERQQADGVSHTSRMLLAAGQEHRLAILTLLTAGGTQSVSDLCGVSGLPMATVSHHLQLLTRAGLTQAARNGNEMLYRVAPEIRVEPTSQQYLGGWQLGGMHLLMVNPTWTPEPEPAKAPTPTPKPKKKRKAG